MKRKFVVVENRNKKEVHYYKDGSKIITLQVINPLNEIFIHLKELFLESNSNSTELSGKKIKSVVVNYE